MFPMSCCSLNILNCCRMTDTPVKVYLYDISKGMARALSPAFLGRQIAGVWHTGVVVYNQEFYFGGMGGIASCPVGGTILGAPDTVLDMGTTQVTLEIFMNFLADLSSSTYKPEQYHLLEHNCNNFTADAVNFLTGRNIPSYITGLPREVLSTPFGAILKPFVDKMYVQPSTGHSLFNDGHSRRTHNDGSSHSHSDSHSHSHTPSHTHSHSDNHSGSQSESHSASGSDHKSDDVTHLNKNHSSNTETLSENIAEPAIFKPDEKFLEQYGRTDETINSFPPGDVELWLEIKEYLSESDCSFSLGRSHLELIGKVMNNSEVSVQNKICTCQLLQLLVLKDSFLHLLSHDTSHMISGLLNHFDEQQLPIKTCLVKVLANCHCSESSRTVISNIKDSEANSLKAEMRISRICISCLLDETVADMKEAAAGLALNISLGKVDSDTVLEIGSALLHCLQQPLPTENTTTYCLSSLSQFMVHNAEVRALAGVMEIVWSQHAGISPKVEKICDKIQSQIIE